MGKMTIYIHKGWETRVCAMVTPDKQPHYPEECQEANIFLPMTHRNVKVHKNAKPWYRRRTKPYEALSGGDRALASGNVVARRTGGGEKYEFRFMGGMWPKRKG